MGIVMLGKLWKYIAHIIATYNTTIQDHHTIKLLTFDNYYPKLSLTYRLANWLHGALVREYCILLCIKLFYGAESWL